MTSRLRRRAWVLLVAALALPGWAVTHALIHRHLAHHHGEGAGHHHTDPSHRHAERPAAPHEAEGLTLSSDERAHEHGHLDVALLPTNRSQLAPMPVAPPAASPEPGVAPPSHVRVAQERAPPRAGPEPADPSRPRAPPQA